MWILLEVSHNPGEACAVSRSYHSSEVAVFPYLSQLVKDLTSLPPAVLNRGSTGGSAPPSSHEVGKMLDCCTKALSRPVAATGGPIATTYYAEREAASLGIAQRVDKASNAQGMAKFPSAIISFSPHNPAAKTPSSLSLTRQNMPTKQPPARDRRDDAKRSKNKIFAPSSRVMKKNSQGTKKSLEKVKAQRNAGLERAVHGADNNAHNRRSMPLVLRTKKLPTRKSGEGLAHHISTHSSLIKRDTSKSDGRVLSTTTATVQRKDEAAHASVSSMTSRQRDRPAAAPLPEALNRPWQSLEGEAPLVHSRKPDVRKRTKFISPPSTLRRVGLFR